MSNALTKQARYLVIIALLAAYGVNAIASLGDQVAEDQAERDQVAGYETAKLGRHLDSPDVFPQWVPEGQQVAMVEALAGLQEKSARAHKPFSLGKDGKIFGIFSNFYMRHKRQYAGVCRKALSLAECKNKLWEKTRGLLGEKLRKTSVWAINELLFLNDGPEDFKFDAPKAAVMSSVGLAQGPGLDEYLAPRVFELNPGGLRPALFNRHPDYAAAAPLLGNIRKGEVSSLFFDRKKSRDVFAAKFERARKIFEIEWRLFAANILLPHTLLVSVARAASDAFLLPPTRARNKVSALYSEVCDASPAKAARSPEISALCGFIDQKR